jgi:hypothetical protein
MRSGYALKLTAVGLKVIAVDEGSPDAIEPGEAPQPQAKDGASPDEGGDPARLAAPRDGSKLALVIELLRRADGATIVDLTQATGWLPHTTRAALTGLRKRGYAVIRERIGAGDSAYRISGAPAHRGDSTVRQRDAMDCRGPRARRRKRRNRRDPQASHVRTGGEAAGKVSAGGFAAPRCFSALHRGGSRGSRSQWAAPSMARPLGR